MKRRIRDIALSVLVILAIALAMVTRSGSEEIWDWMRFGAWPMCQELPVECAPYKEGSPQKVELSDWLFRQLDQVNRAVNREVEPIDDVDHYGLKERWTYPTDGKGDCEDFALEKRRRLVEMGWPRHALLISIVEGPIKGARDLLHAVLIVRTDDGDKILDNLNREVVDRSVSRYRYLFIQSQRDPREWIEQ